MMDMMIFDEKDEKVDDGMDLNEDAEWECGGHDGDYDDDGDNDDDDDNDFNGKIVLLLLKIKTFLNSFQWKII